MVWNTLMTLHVWQRIQLGPSPIAFFDWKDGELRWTPGWCRDRTSTACCLQSPVTPNVLSENSHQLRTNIHFRCFFINDHSISLTGWWVGTMEFYDFPLGIPSTQLTFTPSFFRGVGKNGKNHQPALTEILWYTIYIYTPYYIIYSYINNIIYIRY